MFVTPEHERFLDGFQYYDLTHLFNDDAIEKVQIDGDLSILFIKNDDSVINAMLAEWAYQDDTPKFSIIFQCTYPLFEIEESGEIRHIWWQQYEQGYINYMNIDNVITALNYLKKRSLD